LHENQTNQVIDCGLTQTLAYTGAPVLLDSYPKHTGEPNFKKP